MLDHSREIISLSFSADGARLASGSTDGSIRVWDGALLCTIQESQFLLNLHFSPTYNRILATAGGGPLIRLWDTDSGETMRSTAGHGMAVFSPDGRTIATACPSSNILRMVNLDSRTRRLTIFLHNEVATFCAAFSVDGSELATGGDDGTCKVRRLTQDYESRLNYESRLTT